MTTSVAGKSAEQLLHEFRSNSAADVAMSLLRSKDALLYLALMAAHLGDGQIVDGQTLTAEMDADLPVLLRSYTPAEGEGAATLAIQDADVLLTRWTKRGVGASQRRSRKPHRAVSADFWGQPGGPADAQPATADVDSNRVGAGDGDGRTAADRHGCEP